MYNAHLHNQKNLIHSYRYLYHSYQEPVEMAKTDFLFILVSFSVPMEWNVWMCIESFRSGTIIPLPTSPPLPSVINRKNKEKDGDDEEEEEEITRKLP